MSAAARWGKILCLVACFSVFPAHGHTLSVSHVDIDTRAQQVDVAVDLSLRDVALTVPVDSNRDERITWGELQGGNAALIALVQSTIQVSRGQERCALRPTGLGVRQYDDGAYAALSFRAECRSGGPLRVSYNTFFDRDPQHRAIISFHVDGAVETQIARSDARDFVFGTEDQSPFQQFLREGIHHILVGYDHLAFLLSLLLTSTLVRSDNKWFPTHNIRQSLRHVFGIVTAFTVAHSVTLSLAALNLVTPASRVVEPAIAASVAIAALNNLRPVVTRRIWVVAVVFGLVHGFGFAGALTEIGLPKNAALKSLVGFNLGVEIGQLTVVALTLPFLYIARSWQGYRRVVMPVLSACIALLALAWFIQRLTP